MNVFARAQRYQADRNDHQKTTKRFDHVKKIGKHVKEKFVEKIRALHLTSVFKKPPAKFGLGNLLFLFLLYTIFNTILFLQFLLYIIFNNIIFL